MAIGRRQRWGERTRPMTVRYPESHMAIYERRAQARGLSINEYLVITSAAAHGLDLGDKTGSDDQTQLDLAPEPTDQPEEQQRMAS